MHILDLIVVPASDADMAVLKERVVSGRHPPGRMMSAQNVITLLCFQRYVAHVNHVSASVCVAEVCDPVKRNEIKHFKQTFYVIFRSIH